MSDEVDIKTMRLRNGYDLIAGWSRKYRFHMVQERIRHIVYITCRSRGKQNICECFNRLFHSHKFFFSTVFYKTKDTEVPSDSTDNKIAVMPRDIVVSRQLSFLVIRSQTCKKPISNMIVNYCSCLPLFVFCICI